ncbi:MAG: dienelactone hydrolase family protein [Planctomycetaceae bacterium]|nr:dienelactone hydrolase family protein [Planctomycetaceae bacterium]
MRTSRFLARVEDADDDRKSANPGRYMALTVVALFLASIPSQEVHGQDSKGAVDVSKPKLTDLYQDRTITFTGGEYKNETIHYRLMSPEVVEPGKTYPLVIFLHGAGERGTDNELQLLYFPTQMAEEKWRKKYPCFILAPQCRPERKWMEVDWASPNDPVTPEEVSEQSLAVEQMIQKTLKEEPVDRSRVYLTGLSMGGFGSFDLGARHPEWFAAVAPICGAADPKKMAALKNVPVYIVHGDSDTVVPVERSRSAVRALKEAGANPVYKELPGVGHNSWTPGYSDEEGLVPWMFKQKKQ